MKKGLRIGIVTLFLLLIIAAAIVLIFGSGKDKIVGGMIWIGEGDPPEPETISLRYVKGGENSMEIACDNMDLFPVVIIEEIKDGEVQRTYSYTDKRLEEVSITDMGKDSVINATLYYNEYYDESKDLYGNGYQIFEKEDGSLYAEFDKAAPRFLITKGIRHMYMCINMENKRSTFGKINFQLEDRQHAFDKVQFE